MGIVEESLKQKQREVDAYNRAANPRAYVNSGQMDRDLKSGKIDRADMQQMVDAVNTANNADRKRKKKKKKK